MAVSHDIVENTFSTTLVPNDDVDSNSVLFIHHENKLSIFRGSTGGVIVIEFVGTFQHFDMDKYNQFVNGEIAAYEFLNYAYDNLEV